MFDRIRKKKRKVPTVRPEDLPETVIFNEIDYEGEHIDLSVPIVADVSLDEDGDVLLLNEETCVYGIGPTLEDAMEDFCGVFLVNYMVLLKYGPGNSKWEPIMRHVGDSTIQKKVRPSPEPSWCPTMC